VAQKPRVEIAVESMFPADDATREALLAISHD
jgi:hypothetical protein